MYTPRWHVPKGLKDKTFREGANPSDQIETRLPSKNTALKGETAMQDNTAVFDNYEVKAAVPGYRISDPQTSKQAFESVNIPQREQDVLDALASLGGDGTCDEVTEVCSTVHARAEVPSNFSPRISQLRRKGFIEDTPDKRKSRQGSNQKVVKLTQKGWERAHAFSHPRSGQ
jgi:hypothetical protein